MKFAFTCPSCSQRIEFPESSLGKKITCPHCKKDVDHPELDDDLDELKKDYEGDEAYGLDPIQRQLDTEKPQNHPVTDALLKLQGIPYLIFLLLVFFCESEFWQEVSLWFLLAGIIMSVVTFFMPKSGVQFHLFTDEEVVAEGKVKNAKDKVFYARVTDFRLVISVYRYGITIDGFDDIVRFFQRPKTVDEEIILCEVFDCELDKDHKKITFSYDDKHYTFTGKKEFIESLAKTIDL